MATVTAIAIGVMVVVFPIGAAATIDAAIRTRCRRRHVRAPNGGGVVDNDAAVADVPAALPLPPSGATDPTAAVLTKTRDGTAAVTATATAVMATATEEDECNKCDGVDPRHHLDDSLLRLADGILLRSITTTAAPRRGSGGVWQPQ